MLLVAFLGIVRHELNLTIIRIVQLVSGLRSSFINTRDTVSSKFGQNIHLTQVSPTNETRILSRERDSEFLRYFVNG